MNDGPFSWTAQLADHAAYVVARQAELAAGPEPIGRGRTRSGRRAKCTHEAADHKREALLQALRDGRPHRFSEMRAALPESSCQGIAYLLETLAVDGRITITKLSLTRRAYQLI